MLNYIWAGMLMFSFIVAVFNDKMLEVSNSIVLSSKSAIELSIGLVGIMCFWTGLMKIAEKSGLIEKISNMVMPIMRVLFPEIPKGHSSLGAIVMNLVSNFLGLGNVSTPLGIKAMNELEKLNKEKGTATNSMCMFLILNSSAIQFIPATVIALRTAANSSNPGEIISLTWIASGCAMLTGVLLVKIFSKIY